MTYTHDGSHNGVPHHATPLSHDDGILYEEMRHDLMVSDELSEVLGVITVAEAATMSGLSKSAVIKAWHRGCFTGRMAGRTLIISNTSFVRWYTEE